VRRLALAAILLAASTACTNERAESLRAEIEKAKKERVEVAVVEKAKQETAEAEAGLAASRTAFEQVRADAAKLEADRDHAREALAAEVARNQKLQAEIGDVAQRAQERAARGQELDAKIARIQARASSVRDQAAVFAREIRAEDPGWATARRIDALDEFVARVAQEYPDDPAIAELARTPVPAEKRPTPEQARAAAVQAARLRDRFASVYELPPPAVATSAPAGEAKP
jgi:uncharacterized protein (DUF3084 family)